MAGTFTWTNLLATVHCTSTSADSQAQLCHYQQIHFYMNTLTGDYSNYVSKMAPGRRLKIRTITERDEEITLWKHCNALPIKHQLTMNWTSLANERAQLTNEKCSTLCSQFVSKYCHHHLNKVCICTDQASGEPALKTKLMLHLDTITISPLPLGVPDNWRLFYFFIYDFTISIASGAAMVVSSFTDDTATK